MKQCSVYANTRATHCITWIIGSQLLCLMMLMLADGAAWAATCTSQHTGSWNSSYRWDCGHVPALGDTVVIDNNTTVTLNINTAAVASVTINSGSTLVGSTYNLNTGTVTINSGGTYNAGSAGTDTLTGAFSNGGTYTNGGANVALGGGFSNTGNFSAGSGTWTFNGSATQNISGAPTFTNLTVNNSNGVTLAGNTTVSTQLTTTSGSMVVGAYTLTLNGPTIAGTPSLTTTASSSLVFGGSSTGVTLPSSVATVGNLTVNNTNGVTLAGNTTVSGTLTLGANSVTTGSNLLTTTGNCTSAVSRSTGFVIGSLRLTFPSGTTTCTYPVGTGTTYAPINLTLTTTSSGTLTGSTTAGDHPQILSANIDNSHDVTRYWTLFTAGDTLNTTNVTSYNATFTFVASDIDSGSNTANFFVDQYVNGAWSALITPSATTSTSTSIANIAGSAGFGDFAVGQQLSNCFQDTFARANGAPGSNWSVGAEYGNWTPQIVTVNNNKRLQLTDANGSEATWATLLNTFPGAGNRVSVEFDEFAYGGTGADGIAVILSDASIPPVAGAFGGSMGFAQKSNPGSDCTTVGGCPGFSGGWLGVALDEYGNFSTAVEGRYGGQTLYGYNGTTLVPDSVSIRGSGSGMSGYRFLVGTNSLTPTIDGTANQNANPPYHYRITVDHTNSVNAYLSVERDTTSGGTNYTTLLGCAASNISGCSNAIDVLNPVNSQSAVPTNWMVSFTGSSGGATNYHQMGNLTICTTLGIRTSTLNHLRIYQPGSACTGTSSPASITIKACADTACSSLYLGPVTVSLSATGNATWSSASPITITGGQATLTLSDNTAESVTVGATATSPSAANTTLCYNNSGTSVSCTGAVTYSVCTFDVVEVGTNAYTPIYTKLAGVSFNLDAISLATSGSQTVTKYEIVNASTGTCGTYPSLTSSSTNSTFSAGQRRTLSFSDANAVRNARIRLTYGGGQTACSSDNFAIRPTQFTLTTTASNTNTTGTPVFRAGTDSATVTATALAGYDGTPKFNLSPSVTMLATGAPNTQTLGTTSVSAFTTANAGTGVATAYVNYFDVGNIIISANAVYDDGFTAVDATKPTPECTPDFSNTLSASSIVSGRMVGGQYGCMFGSPSLELGRFIPDHLSVTAPVITSGCSAGTTPYTYMGQDFTTNFTLNASNGLGQTTINYDPTKFAAAFGTTTWSNYNFSFVTNSTHTSSSSLAQGATAPTGAWSSGVANVVARSHYTRPTPVSPNVPDGDFPSFSVYAAPSYTEGSGTGAITVSALSTLMGSTAMRFGIVWLGNAYGVDDASLAVPYQFQYWNGTAFVTNTDDQCSASALLTASIGLSNYQPSSALNATNLGHSHLTGVNPSSTSGGSGTITLTAPTPNGTTHYSGSVDLVIDLGTTTTTNSPAPDYLTNLTGANLSYLRGNWYNTYPWTSDPVCRATFGIYNNNRTGPGPVYLRENY